MIVLNPLDIIMLEEILDRKKIREEDLSYLEVNNKKELKILINESTKEGDDE